MTHNERRLVASVQKKSEQLDRVLQVLADLEARVHELELRCPPADGEKEMLQDELDKMGVEYKGNYGVKRLREMVEFAKKEMENLTNES